MVAAVEEVGVARALLVLGGEDGSGHGGRVEGMHKLVRARQHALDLLRGGEVGEDEEAVFAELLNLLGGERPVEGDAHGDARLLGSQCLEESCADVLGVSSARQYPPARLHEWITSVRVQMGDDPHRNFRGRISSDLAEECAHDDGMGRPGG